jgi:hypothetical protein
MDKPVGNIIHRLVHILWINLVSGLLTRQGPAHTGVAIFATDAVYVFNGVDEGGAAPAATARKGYTSTQAASGIQLVFGGRVAGQDYATVCIAAQTGTVTVEAYTLPPERVAP